MGNVINVGLGLGVAWWWIEDGLDWFVGSPVSLNPVVALKYKQNTVAIFDKTVEKIRETVIYSRARARR